MSGAAEPLFVSSAGNRFLLFDGLIAEPPADPAAVARRRCDRTARAGERLDGVLLVTRARSFDGIAMVVFNADGSRAEACGNGLLCVGRYAATQPWASADELRIETDAGVRSLELGRTRDGEVIVRTSLGAARILERDIALEAGELALTATLVDVGNPHCVLFAPECPAARLEECGPALERHPRFPRGTNVELVARGTASELDMRVWERGVGETAACGTGACAAAAAAAERWEVPWPMRVRMPGGVLEVSRDRRGELWIAELSPEPASPRR